MIPSTTIKTHDENGNLHSKNKNPSLEWNDGSKFWHKHGKFHRINAPAVNYGNGYTAWYKNGILTNENGPAIIYSNGDKEYWINGKLLSEKEFLEVTNKNPEKDFNKIKKLLTESN